MPSEQLKAKREETLRTHLRGESEKNLELVLSTMPNPRYDLVTVGRIVEGRGPVSRLLNNLFEGTGPNTHHADAIHHSEDHVVVEVRTVFPDGFDGASPGQVLEVRSVGIFPFDGETLLGEKLYADAAGVMPLLAGID